MIYQLLIAQLIRARSMNNPFFAKIFLLTFNTINDETDIGFFAHGLACSFHS